MARVVVDRSALKTLRKAISGAHGIKTTTGWLESAKYDDNTPVAGIAAVHEFGSAGQGIPPRPFIRPTVSEKSAEWDALLAEGAKAVLEGRRTMTQVMQALGLKSAADIKNAIAQYNGIPLKDATVKARIRKKADGKTVGSLTKPLVEEAIMINTITSETTNE